MEVTNYFPPLPFVPTSRGTLIITEYQIFSSVLATTIPER